GNSHNDRAVSRRGSTYPTRCYRGEGTRHKRVLGGIPPATTNMEGEAPDPICPRKPYNSRMDLTVTVATQRVLRPRCLLVVPEAHAHVRKNYGRGRREEPLA